MLRRMASAIPHRGPDGLGFFRRGSVGFAHRRLSIIDLSGSPQPMSDSSARLHVCFNGEILNYAELRRETPYAYRTNGDTEVLLSLYARHGAASVEHLIGQFAYALFDETSDDLWLFRDRLGVLPLYYYADKEKVLFASEIKAIIAALGEPPQVDEKSVVEYLMRRYVPAPWTMFKGIRKLMPGHRLCVGPDGAREPVAYWSLPVGPTRTVGQLEAVDGLRSSLITAVDRNLVADVQVGAYLSGGVDSSLLVALAARQRASGSLLTFSAGFSDTSLDERPFARQVADQFQTDHREVVLRPDDFEGLWHPLTWHRDAPLSEASDIAVHGLARLAREHVKVVLSGEGSDELFGGYPKYRFASVTRAAGLLPAILRGPTLNAIQKRVPAHRWKLRTAIRAMAATTEADRYETWFWSFTRREAIRLSEHGKAASRFEQAGLAKHTDAVQRMSALDTSYYLPDNLLERGDRMSMAASLETRPPFLDPGVVSYAVHLPSEYKVRAGQTKWVVKELAREMLPRAITDRPKVGFRVPLEDWFRSGLRDMARSRLLDKNSFVAQALDRKLVADVVRRHDDGVGNESGRLWNLLALEVWHEVFYRDMYRQEV